jgi:hypothetical protein
VPRNAPFSTKLVAIAAALCFPQIRTCTKYIHVRVYYIYIIYIYICIGTCMCLCVYVCMFT